MSQIKATRYHCLVILEIIHLLGAAYFLIYQNSLLV